MIHGNVLKIIVMLMIFLLVNVRHVTADVSGEYDLKTEVDLSGIIIKEIDRERGPRIFLFKSNDRFYQVVTGPRWYLWKIGLFLNEGSSVEITGSRVLDREGNLYLLIYNLRIKDTGELYKFRDRNMKPLWRRKNRMRGD
jgi:hypothetical protein